MAINSFRCDVSDTSAETEPLSLTSASVFKVTVNIGLDTLIQKIFVYIMEIYNFLGDLTDNSARKEPQLLTWSRVRQAAVRAPAGCVSSRLEDSSFSSSADTRPGRSMGLPSPSRGTGAMPRICEHVGSTLSSSSVRMQARQLARDRTRRSLNRPVHTCVCCPCTISHWFTHARIFVGF